MSKSRGNFITAESYPQAGAESRVGCATTTRASINSTMEDIDLNLEDFVARVEQRFGGEVREYSEPLRRIHCQTILMESCLSLKKLWVS